MFFTQEESARKFLDNGYAFFPCEDDDDPKQMLNMNDVFGWAVAWGEPVDDSELIEVANLLRAYGDPGLIYWVSKKNGWMRSEFKDVNRFIDFVRNEERISLECPNSDRRAYYKATYTLGEE